MSKRSRGREKERLARDELEESGWTTFLVPPSFKFNQSNDIFGMFDIVAVFKGYNNRWIQVTTGQTRGRLKKLSEFKKKYMNDDEDVELWVWKKYKGWNKYRIKEDGYSVIHKA